MIQTTSASPFTLGTLVKRFRRKISFTMLLVFLDAVVNLLFPLFMGFAINDLLAGTFNGLIGLAVLGSISLFLGAGRRLYDTRAYSHIYTTLISELIVKEQRKASSVSTISARTNLFTEIVEFLENSFPAIANRLIAFVGTLFIIATLNRDIFIACLVASIFIVLIYWAGERRNFNLNRGYNDELERQIDVLNLADIQQINTHYTRVMRWNIKLSDFETANFSLAWVAMIMLLLYAIYTAVTSGLGAFGTIFSLIIYVFEYIESVIVLPLYFQQLIRLKEISSRLNS